ncbi:MAG TPA: SUMF1/EgtB/PvdO family nonheme iron enzyme, partial [Isosphaeraceae bacterium]|nr:SUMF1/EgtB/PvdO family nonheme iron enzyme [Isosphaeraceae bacterium]
MARRKPIAASPSPPGAQSQEIETRRLHPAARVLGLLGLMLLAFLCTYLLTRGLSGARPQSAPPGMIWVRGGEFVMGTDSETAWPDERPAHRVRVDGFWIDEHEVTNAEFGAFVKATGYVTTAERAPSAEEILRQSPPGTPAPAPELLVPGSLVFTPPDRPVPLDDYSQWWKWTPG